MARTKHPDNLLKTPCASTPSRDTISTLGAQMPRKARFPELPSKFLNALRSFLETQPDGTALTGDIIDGVPRFGDFSPEEVETIARSPGYYLGKAQDAGEIRSNGRWKGYTLVVPSTAEDDTGLTGVAEAIALPTDESTDAHDPTIPPVPLERRNIQQWESLLHLPLTIALHNWRSNSRTHAQSFPKFTSRAKWGNPDMAVVRQGPFSDILKYAEVDRAEFDPALFKKVTAEPEYIISSFELKVFDTKVSRSGYFDALSEAMANGSWANETWLAFLPKGDRNGLPSDVVGQARRLGIGVLELIVENDPEQRLPPVLRLQEHVGAELRRSLDFATLLGESRDGPLVNIKDHVRRVGQHLQMFEEWCEQLDEETDESEQVLDLIARAESNLQQQVGFTRRSDWAKSLRLLEPQLRLRNLLDATVNTLVTNFAVWQAVPVDRKVGLGRLDLRATQLKELDEWMREFDWELVR